MKSDIELTDEQVKALLEAGFEPTMEPQLIELEEVQRKMAKGQEITFTFRGRTNVKNQALISPEVLTVALFELLYALHGNDYDRFRGSCIAAYQTTVHHTQLHQAA